MEIQYFSERLFQFTEDLERATRTKYARLLRLLEQYGPSLRMPYVKKVEANLFEIRVRGREEVRLFFTYSDSKILMLHGYVKKTEKIPLHELDLARSRLKAFEKK